MKYAPGLMVGQLSGKSGSTVASRNRFGSYFKSRNMPVNPNTDSQQDQRNNLAAISAAWKSLTDAQRSAWIAATASVSLVDSLGIPYNPTGQQLFVSVNRNTFIYSGSSTITDDPPPLNPVTALTSISTSVASGPTVMSITFAASPLAASTKLVIEATPCLSPGINFIKRSLYRQIIISAAAAATPLNAASAYVAKFGEVVAGKRIFFRAYTLRSTGERSPYISFYSDVT